MWIFEIDSFSISKSFHLKHIKTFGFSILVEDRGNQDFLWNLLVMNMNQFTDVLGFGLLIKNLIELSCWWMERVPSHHHSPFLQSQSAHVLPSGKTICSIWSRISVDKSNQRAQLVSEFRIERITRGQERHSEKYLKGIACAACAGACAAAAAIAPTDALRARAQTKHAWQAAHSEASK